MYHRDLTRHNEEIARRGADLQERIRAAQVEHYKETLKHARFHGHNRRVAGGYRLTLNVMENIVNAAGGFCCWCNHPIKKGHVDHIVPVSKGGTNHPSNLVYICSGCNLRKHDMSVLEFLLWRMGR